MLTNFTLVESILANAINVTCPAAQIEVRQQGQVILARAYGWLDPDQQRQPTQPDTRFDLASVTKLFVATTFMRLVEQGLVAVDQPVATVLPACTGLRPVQPYEDPLQPGQTVCLTTDSDPVDLARITFHHLLTHTSGLPAWRPLFRQADRLAARQMALTTFCSYPTGTQVLYSDIGLILLGLAIEELTGLSLPQALDQQVLAPLGLQHTGYLPITHGAVEQPNIAPTEFCQWRQRRIQGEVHDENAAHLGGVSGHAGLFSTAHEVAAFGQSFLDATLLSPWTIAEMSREQARSGDLRRGLGFALWSPDPEASGNPFGQRAFGHTGFTGTSLWIDPDRALVVALLTNDVYYGRQGRGIAPLRVLVHRAVMEAL